MSLFKVTLSLGLLLPPYQLFQHQLLSNKENHFEKRLTVADSWWSALQISLFSSNVGKYDQTNSECGHVLRSACKKNVRKRKLTKWNKFDSKSAIYILKTFQDKIYFFSKTTRNTNNKLIIIAFIDWKVTLKMMTCWLVSAVD